VLRDGWSLLRLFTVGIAWGTPLIFAGLASASVDLSAHPWLDPWLPWLMALAFLLVPLLAVVGIAVVAHLSAEPPRLNAASVVCFVVIAGLPLLAWSALSALEPVFDFLVFDTPEDLGFTMFVGLVALPVVLAILALALAAVLGLGVTLVTLWRHRKWLAPVWLAAWLPVCLLVWFGDRRTSGGSGDVAAGLFVGLLAVSLYGTSLVATVIVAGMQARRHGLAMQPQGSGV
jgi:hypothetical protein